MSEIASRCERQNNCRSRYLVIVRAGKTSTHSDWCCDASLRNFDIYVSYYDRRCALDCAHADYIEHRPGFKFPVLLEILATQPRILDRYDVFWFPDDDILADVSIICRMFKVFESCALWLAQPSLAASSYINQGITVARTGLSIRFTNFVEIMCPIFSRDSLIRLYRTFGQSMSGWGLDNLWPHLLGYPKDRIAILDETPVIHSRKPQTGPFYEQCEARRINPRLEMIQILQKYQIPLNGGTPVHCVYRTIQKGG